MNKIVPVLGGVAVLGTIGFLVFRKTSQSEEEEQPPLHKFVVGDQTVSAEDVLANNFFDGRVAYVLSLDEVNRTYHIKESGFTYYPPSADHPTGLVSVASQYFDISFDDELVWAINMMPIYYKPSSVDGITIHYLWPNAKSPDFAVNDLIWSPAHSPTAFRVESFSTLAYVLRTIESPGGTPYLDMAISYPIESVDDPRNGFVIYSA